MKKVGIVTLLLLGAVGFTRAGSLREDYHQYLKKYAKSAQFGKYTYDAYVDNVNEIKLHNAQSGQLYSRGVNQFTGVPHEEMARHLKSGSHLKGNYQCPTNADEFYSYVPVFDSKWDYREQGVKSPVRDQGFQGLGQIHASVSAIEQFYQSKYSLETKRFSAQQAFDCIDEVMKETLTTGDVYQYYAQSGGVATEDAYPFYHSTGYCIFNYTMDGIQLGGSIGYQRVTPDDEVQLVRALRQKGPITVMFSVTNDFYSYKDGIYTHPAPATCMRAGTNHALLVIGFGTEGGVDYWLVQNSWGTGWGQQGFAKIQRGKNVCGIASCATFPINIIDPWKEPYRGFSRHFHDVEATGARCLDGSPAGLFYSKGFGDGANKTIIYFDGGGWCYGQDT